MYKELTDEGRPARNFKNGRFLKGHIPHNRGKKWDAWMDMRKAKKVLRIGRLNLTPRHDIGGWNKKAVIGVRSDGEYLYFSSATKAAEVLHLTRRNISHCCNRKRSRCGNFYWFFAEDDAWIDLCRKLKREQQQPPGWAAG